VAREVPKTAAGRGCAIHREAKESGDAFANLDAEERLRDMTFDSAAVYQH